MSTISNQMMITKSSLSSISRELIDKRIYKEGLITTVGSPVVTNGVAAKFSENSYFISNNFSFKPDANSFKFTFNGLYAPSTRTSCAYTLTGTNINSLSLLFTSTSIALKYGTTTLIQFTDLNMGIENSIETTVVITNTYSNEELQSQNYSFTLILNEERVTKTLKLVTPIKFSKYNLLTLGNDSTHTNYWEGDIYLPEFALYQNNSIIYTPSVRNSFKFTKIIIADNSVNLTDTTQDILNHAYSSDTTVISKNNNNVLLTATVKESAYLNIEQVGLYYENESGTHLFSIIKNLAIRKTSDLTYNLIIHVNLDINVVNTTIIPEIIVNEKEYARASNFITIKEVYTYITENLERMIKLNSLGIGNYLNCQCTGENNGTPVSFLPTRPIGLKDISQYGIMSDIKPVGVGYNKAQVYYRWEKELNDIKSSFSSVNSYVAINSKIYPHIVKYFSRDQLIGSALINMDSKTASQFSTSSYLYTNSFDISASMDWTFKTSFRTSGTITNEQEIVCFSCNAIGQPLTLGIKNGYIKLKISGADEAMVSDGTNTYSYHRFDVGETGSYGWKSNSNLINNVIYSSVYKDPTNSTVIYDSEGNVLSGWTFTQAPNSITLFNNQELFAVQPSKEYFVEVSYTKGVYTVTCSDGIAQSSYNFSSSIELNKVGKTYFGVGYNNDSIINPFSGSINLGETSLLNEIYTNQGVLEDSFLTEFYNKDKFTSKLLDYFHIPTYPQSYYLVNNLNVEQNSYLEIFEGNLVGNNDQIDFNNPNGFTLYIKMLLKNIPSQEEGARLILSKKSSSSNEVYFTFTETTEGSLVFNLRFSPTVYLTLTAPSTIESSRKYLENPIGVTITCSQNGNSLSIFKMFKNNILVDQVTVEGSLYKNLVQFNLMSQSSSENPYIIDILSFSGSLNENDIFYINNSLDTNF